MTRHFDKFVVKHGLLYWEVVEKTEKIQQLVVPSYFRKQILLSLHNQVGHPGREKTVSLVKDRFYWPAYTSDISRWIDGYDRCLRRKSSTAVRAPLVSIKSSFPLELVSTEFLKVDACSGGIRNILVITDHFTNYTVAVPTKNRQRGPQPKLLSTALFCIMVCHRNSFQIRAQILKAR